MLRAKVETDPGSGVGAQPGVDHQELRATRERRLPRTSEGDSPRKTVRDRCAGDADGVAILPYRTRAPDI